MAREPDTGPLRRTSIKEAVALLAGRKDRVDRLERGRPAEGATAQVRDTTDSMTFNDTPTSTGNDISDAAVTHCDVMDSDFGISK